MSKESSELLASLQKAWEGAQQQLAELKKQVQERVVLETFLSEREQAEQKRQKALGDFGMVVYAEIQRGAIEPQKRWEGLLQRISEALQKSQEHQQRLSELLEEGQALVSQAKEEKKAL